MARYLLDREFAVVGVDASPAMIGLCQARFPDSEWIVADMRRLDLRHRFDGILAWDSTFHLGGDDQREMFPRFELRAHVESDPECGGHTVWLATFEKANHIPPHPTHK